MKRILPKIVAGMAFAVSAMLFLGCGAAQEPMSAEDWAFGKVVVESIGCIFGIWVIGIYLEFGACNLGFNIFGYVDKCRNWLKATGN